MLCTHKGLLGTYVMFFPAVGCFSKDIFALSGSVAFFTAVDAKKNKLKVKTNKKW